MIKKRSWLTAWVPRRLEYLLSPSWSLAPRPLKNVIERLEIEHLRHGGFKNGELYVAYSSFEKHGVSRKGIRVLLQLGQDLGLLEIITAGEEVRTTLIREPNSYRLTHLEMKGNPPTDEWKTVTEERAKSLVAEFRKTDRALVAGIPRKLREKDAKNVQN